MLAIGRQAIEQVEDRVRRARPEIDPQRRIEAEQALDRIALEIIVGEIGDVHREDAGQLQHVLLAQHAELQGEHGQRQLGLEIVGRDRGARWGAGEEAAQSRRDLVEPRGHPRPGLGIGLGNLRNRGRGRSGVRGDFDALSSGSSTEVPIGVRSSFNPRSLTTPRVQRMQDMGDTGDLESRRELARHRRATDAVAGFHDDDLLACFRQSGRGDQAIMAAPMMATS